MTAFNSVSIRPAFFDENAISKSQFNCRHLEKSGMEGYCQLAKQAQESTPPQNLSRLATLLPSALEEMGEKEAKAELQKYVESPLFGYLLRDMSEPGVALLKVLSQQLFKHGLLFNAVREAFIGDSAPDIRQYEIIQKAVYAQLNENMQKCAESEAGSQLGEPDWKFKIPYQQGGVPPSLSSLQGIVAAQARKVVEKTLGYDNKYFKEIASLTDTLDRSTYVAVKLARELLLAKFSMMLKFEKQDLLFQIPSSASSEDGEGFDHIKVSFIKQQIQSTDNYCLSLVKIAKKSNVQIPKIAMAYMYGTSPDWQMKRFEVLKLRGTASITQRSQVCALELLGIWAGSETLFRQIIVSQEGANNKLFQDLLDQFDARNKMIDTIVDELNECIDWSNLRRPSQSLKKLFISVQVKQDVNLINQQVIDILEGMKSKEVGLLLQGCPRLNEYLKGIANPPAVLKEAFKRVHEIDVAISEAEKRSYRQTCLYEVLYEIKLHGLQDPSYWLQSRFYTFAQELLQTLCNEQTMAFEFAKDGTFPLFAQFAAKSDEERVELLKSILIDPKKRRELEIEVIRYRDALLSYMRQEGKEYHIAEDQEKAAKRAIFVEALLDILPIYPSALISLHDMIGMDDAVRDELQKKKALFSPIPKLMQEFMLCGWAT